MAILTFSCCFYDFCACMALKGGAWVCEWRGRNEWECKVWLAVQGRIDYICGRHQLGPSLGLSEFWRQTVQKLTLQNCIWNSIWNTVVSKWAHHSRTIVDVLKSFWGISRQLPFRPCNSALLGGPPYVWTVRITVKMQFRALRGWSKLCTLERFRNHWGMAFSPQHF